MSSTTNKKGRTALFPGTFDPPSLGHLDIIKRSANLCDTLYVGIAVNVNKPGALFSIEEREEMLGEITKGISQVKIVPIMGLVTDWAVANHVDFLVRGLGINANNAFEYQMALANHKMSGIETVFLLADSKYAHVSSTLIREIGSCGHLLKDFIPPELEGVVHDKLVNFEYRSTR